MLPPVPYRERVEEARRPEEVMDTVHDHVWPEVNAEGAGTRFSGYRLGKDGIPTFLYEVGGLKFEDTMRPNADASALVRMSMGTAGKSAFEITQERLMLEACRKLTYVPAGVASIAYELGFQDPAYFSRLFKKLVGVTPKEFRQQTTSKAGRSEELP